MKFYIFLCLYFITVTFAADVETTTQKAQINKVECLCPEGINVDECIPKLYCVYGINDAGKIFLNVRNDKMNLTIIARQRMDEIGNFSVDDVLVNLYTPEKEEIAIFYYACRECDDLKAFVNNTTTTSRHVFYTVSSNPKVQFALNFGIVWFTVPKLKIFLLSLYNQRMKYNLKYAQSDYQYFSVTDYIDEDDDSIDEQQPMPIITVRPFWKNRLMLNQTCAQKQQRFTQKHFIPAFLTQDLCILDYQYIHYLNNSEAKNSNSTDGDIIYSLTLSYIDLYSYKIVINSTQELPEQYQNDLERCKVSVEIDSKKRSLRFFCLCNERICTLKASRNDPLKSCPYQLRTEIDTTIEYPSIKQISDYMTVNGLFFQDKDTYCYFTWETTDKGYFGSVEKWADQDASFSLPVGYIVNSNHDDQAFRCPFEYATKEDVDIFHATFYKNDSLKLQQILLTAMTDHTNIANDIQPIGANCSSEGAFSDPFYSSGYGSNSTMFPCYHYYEIYSTKQLYPMMGFNILPISIISKGKDCYFYTMKIDYYHMGWCNESMELPPVITIVVCPENINYDENELIRMKSIVGACPTMEAGASKWEYQASKTDETEIICGQFLRGLKKMENGKYIPERVELRQVNAVDLALTELASEKHGCGFNPSQNLTLCTCYAVLGDCDDLYTVGRLHLMRYVPFGPVI